MTDEPSSGIEVTQALFFLARQQVLSTALLAAHSYTSGAATKEQALAAIEELAGGAERDCEGIEVLGRVYAERLRHYARIIDAGGLPGPSLSVIDGGLSDSTDAS